MGCLRKHYFILEMATVGIILHFCAALVLIARNYYFHKNGVECSQADQAIIANLRSLAAEKHMHCSGGQNPCNMISFNVYTFEGNIILLPL